MRSTIIIYIPLWAKTSISVMQASWSQQLLCYTTPKHIHDGFCCTKLQTYVQHLFYCWLHPGATKLNHLHQAEICSLRPCPASAFSCEANSCALHVTTEKRHVDGRRRTKDFVPLVKTLPSLKMVLYRLNSVIERLATFLSLMMILLQWSICQMSWILNRGDDPYI